MAPPMATPLNFAVIAAAALRRIVPGFSLKLLSKISAQKVGQTNMIFLHNCAKPCEKQKVSKMRIKKLPVNFGEITTCCYLVEQMMSLLDNFFGRCVEVFECPILNFVFCGKDCESSFDPETVGELESTKTLKQNIFQQLISLKYN